MGITYATFIVKESRKSTAEKKVDFMIDSGAVYSLVPGKILDAPVIYGEANDTALLGVTTLDALGLVLNPFTRTLHPMRLLMAG